MLGRAGAFALTDYGAFGLDRIYRCSLLSLAGFEFRFKVAGGKASNPPDWARFMRCSSRDGAGVDFGSTTHPDDPVSSSPFAAERNVDAQWLQERLRPDAP